MRCDAAAQDLSLVFALAALMVGIIVGRFLSGGDPPEGGPRR